MQEFRDKGMMGHASDVAVLKLKSNERNWQKKEFSGLLFFYRSLNLVHLHIFAQTTAQLRSKILMSTYLCIQCAQVSLLALLCRQFIRKIHQKCDKRHF